MNNRDSTPQMRAARLGWIGREKTRKKGIPTIFEYIGPKTNNPQPVSPYDTPALRRWRAVWCGCVTELTRKSLLKAGSAV